MAESFVVGGSVSAFARSRGLSPSQLFAWRKEARSGVLTLPIEDGSEFAALMIEEGAGDEASIAEPAVVEIIVGEVTLRLPEAVSARRVGELTAAVIAASRGRS